LDARDGPARQAIIDFVVSSRTPGAGFIEDAFGAVKENVIGTAAEYSYTDGKTVADQGQGARLDGCQHEKRLEHRLLGREETR
jgi:hypothetical protein